MTKLYFLHIKFSNISVIYKNTGIKPGPNMEIYSPNFMRMQDSSKLYGKIMLLPACFRYIALAAML